MAAAIGVACVVFLLAAWRWGDRIVAWWETKPPSPDGAPLETADEGVTNVIELPRRQHAAGGDSVTDAFREQRL